jgi:long-chain fatty acid transport protein
MKKAILALLLGLALALPLNNVYSAGSGAFRLEVPDAEAMGKGSAFVAQADNPSAIYYNPAGMTQLESKLNVSAGASFIQPFTTYKDNSGNKTEMQRQFFTIPNIFAVSNLGLEKFAFGVGATSDWGLGTYWSGDSFSKYVATRTDLAMQDTMLTAAYEVNNNLSLGLSADYIRSTVDMRRNIIQAPGANAGYQAQGKEDNAWGYRLSALYKLNEKHSFGFMYRSPIHVKQKGKVNLSSLNNSLYPYATVFGGSSYETDITSNSTLPQSMVLGYCFKPDDKWRFEFDLEWMDWASTKETSYDYPGETNATRISYLNSTINPTYERNWHSVFSFALGTEYKVNDNWKLRAGYFHHKTPIAQANFETSLPDASSNSLTLGTGYSFNKNKLLILLMPQCFLIRGTSPTLSEMRWVHLSMENINHLITYI